MSATRKSTNKTLMILFWIALFLSMCGFCIVLGGLAAIQHKANTMPHDPKMAQVYISVFTQANAIPYPNNPAWQFGFQWWIFFFQVFIGLIMIGCGFSQHTLYRAKGVILPLLAVAMTFTWILVEQLLFFSRNAIAMQVWGKMLIKVNLVGVIWISVCNGFSIIALGLIEDPDHVTRAEYNKDANVHHGSPVKPTHETVHVAPPV